jgi:hypothetical protein
MFAGAFLDEVADLAQAGLLKHTPAIWKEAVPAPSAEPFNLAQAIIAFLGLDLPALGFLYIQNAERDETNVSALGHGFVSIIAIRIARSGLRRANSAAMPNSWSRVIPFSSATVAWPILWARA